MTFVTGSFCPQKVMIHRLRATAILCPKQSECHKGKLAGSRRMCLDDTPQSWLPGIREGPVEESALDSVVIPRKL